jgi:hypothetical protein
MSLPRVPTDNEAVTLLEQLAVDDQIALMQKILNGPGYQVMVMEPWVQQWINRHADHVAALAFGHK